MVFGKKKKKVTTYEDGKEVKEGEAPAQAPPLEIPVPVPPPEARAPEQPEPAPEPEPEEIDYFEAGRDQGFMEGLSFAMAQIRRAQNEILQRRNWIKKGE